MPWMIWSGVAALLCGCSKETTTQPEEDPTVQVDPADYVERVDNPFLPLVPGTIFFYEGESDGESERVVVEVTDERTSILGVSCQVVRDRVWIGGDLVEDTFDWFAQHRSGDVWYFGEDSREIEDGEVVSTDGSWTAGVDGAEPGILIEGDPQVGHEYQQEFYEGEAEDRAAVVSLDATVTLGLGVFAGCLQTREWTPLDPGVSEHKFYAPGVGFILEEKIEGGSSRLELVDRVGPADPIVPGEFSIAIDHPYFPLIPGTTFIYEGQSEGESERIVVEVTHDTRQVQGVTCVVVRDRVWIDGELVEDTDDWFAQHRNGDVWYFGEEVEDFEGGVVVSTAGSWEAGLGGARAGVLLPAAPQIGAVYRQELLVGEAEDMIRIVSLSASADVAYGSFSACLETEDVTPLEPDTAERKIYAPGVGMVSTTVLRGGTGYVELIDVSTGN